MIINKKKKVIEFLLIGVLIIMSSIFVSATFGVGFANSKLKLYPGEVFDSSFSLQNNNEPGDLNIEAFIEEGAEYLSFTGESKYEVPVGSSVALPVRITVPEDAKIGDTYNLIVLFKNIPGEAEGEGGTVDFVISVRRTIEIEVIPKPGEEAEGTGTMIYWIIGIIILIVIIWFVAKKKGSISGKAVKK